jgi:hypothetical protein
MENGWELPSLDKQFAREWAKKFMINECKPEIPEDLAYVDGVEVPEEIIKKTNLIYRHIFWRLTGMRIEEYQRNVLGIDIADPSPYEVPHEKEFSLSE